jgi:hypothetical protein
MKTLSDIEEFTWEQKMIHHLMLKSLFIRDCGLLHGKMGITLFFYHYSKHTNNVVYSDFADDLLDDIWETAYNDLPVSFASGLTGIAWGIEYLLQNNFVAGNSNEICEELNNRIMSLDVRRLNSKFIEKELEGLLHYILIRIKGCIRQQIELPFDEEYRNDLRNLFVSLQKTKMISNTCKKLIKQYFDVLRDENSNYIFNLGSFVDKTKEPKMEKEILSFPVGLRTGLAGQLYKQITVSVK